MRTILVILASFVVGIQVNAATLPTPTVRVNTPIAFSDDMDLDNLELAINRQLKAFEAGAGIRGAIRFGRKVYTSSVLKNSLILLNEITSASKECLKMNPREKCISDLSSEINAKFDLYKPIPGKTERGYRAKKTHFTSYYSPDLTGSKVRTERYSRPIYGLPATAEERNLTRVQIDFKNALAGKGYELFWVEDSFYDIYLLQVQGGGRIKILNEDGSHEIHYLSFAGKNARAFKMIYHYMVEKGYLKGDASVPAQRKFLEENPDKMEEIFASCPSYVFFKVTDDEPVGMDNIPLTEGRSIAMDSRIYKTTGIINFVRTVKPVLDADGKIVKVPFARFFIGQDTGGAIRGNARSDLYAGYGQEAELKAYNTNEVGDQFFLLKK